MAGDQGDGLSILFLLRNSAHAIQFRNLFMDAALASNTSEQNHLIQIQGLATDPAGSGAHDIEIVGCYVGEAVGDAVRLAGDDPVPVVVTPAPAPVVAPAAAPAPVEVPVTTVPPASPPAA